MPLRDVVRMIRGKKGTPRRGSPCCARARRPSASTITIVRDKINLEEQAAKLRFETRQVDDKTLKLAVLELPSFYGDRDPSKRQCDQGRAGAASTGREGEGRRPAARPLPQRRRAARARSGHLGLLPQEGPDGGGAALAVADPDAAGPRRRDPLVGPAGGADLARQRVGLRDPRRRAQGLQARRDRRRRPYLREGHRAERRAAAAGPRRAQDHDGALLPAGRRVDPAHRRAGRRGDPLALRSGRVRREALSPTRSRARRSRRSRARPPMRPSPSPAATCL